MQKADSSEVDLNRDLSSGGVWPGRRAHNLTLYPAAQSGAALVTGLVLLPGRDAEPFVVFGYGVADWY